MEIWDLYNDNREIIGEHIRGEELPDNAYHLVVHVWMIDCQDKCNTKNKTQKEPR